MSEQQKSAARKIVRDDAKRILRHLQGEDGYNIFTDRQLEGKRRVKQRDHEDERGLMH